MLGQMSRRGVIILAAAAGVAAAAAVWITLEADFLVYPGWLAAQKADLILGPVLVGLYWLRMRPAARFGWLLVAFVFLCVCYMAESASRPHLFGIGLIWESVIYIRTRVPM